MRNTDNARPSADVNTATGTAAAASPATLVYTASIPIRWGDMDAFGHVNNTVFFRYMEQARILWFSERLGNLGENGNGPVLINAGCTFLRQLRYPGTVEVHIYLGAIGRSSMETTYRLERSDQPGVVYAEGAAKVVWINFEKEKAMALPPHILDRLPGGSLFV